MVIWYDSLQQRGKHEIKHQWLAAHGIELKQTRFDGKHDVPVSFGDYYRDGTNVVIDTKRNLAEIAQNISRDHKRFREECARAQSDGYRLIILVENKERVRCLRDLLEWTNDHCRFCAQYRRHGCTPADTSTKCARHGTLKPIQGARLAKAMATMSAKYGVRFEFCEPTESARRICELLGVIYEQDANSSAEVARARLENDSHQTRHEDSRD